VEERIKWWKASPGGYHALASVDRYVNADSSIEKPLLELVKLRASQINGCAYCIDMHWKDARGEGESEQRLHSLNAWRETSFYTDRERAALAWTEALTLISETHAPDDLYAGVRAQFSEEETADLTLAIATINAWNRMSIGTRAPVPGTYDPTRRRAAEAKPSQTLAGDRTSAENSRPQS
jgi:AhpD family alkylhydroperoxidase